MDPDDTAATGRSSPVPGRARLLVSCADRPGIVAAVSRFLFDHGANILDADQHSSDPRGGGTFSMRMAFERPAAAGPLSQLGVAFEREVAHPFAMRWRLTDAGRPKRIAVLVSKVEHCLVELLWRRRAGDFDDDIVMVISNHDTLRSVVEPFGVPFHHLPIGAGGKAAQEAHVLERLGGDVDLIVLARYMQILSPAFVARYRERIINIHHSFLPAFSGGRPYHRAYERGVKLIGATAHYVTDELDEGPIIEQDVVRVTHRQSVRDLQRLGREIERTVLARAVALHLEDRILVHGNKTVVFA
ncbi:MAG: formyltetrahydrofolate deformylase [Deinococcales bacterium]|jgi:formyltetrahydrofolate deformylase